MTELSWLERLLSEEVMGTVTFKKPFLQGGIAPREYTLYQIELDGQLNPKSTKNSDGKPQVRRAYIYGHFESPNIGDRVSAVIAKKIKFMPAITYAYAFEMDEAFIRKNFPERFDGYRRSTDTFVPFYLMHRIKVLQKAA